MDPLRFLEMGPGLERLAEKALSEREARSDFTGAVSADHALLRAFELGLAAWRSGRDPHADFSRAIAYAARGVKLADLLKGPAEAWRLFPGVSLAAFAQFLVEGKVSDDFKNRMVDWRSWKGSFNEFMWPAMDACLLQVLVRGVTTTDDYASVVARIANRKKTATHHMLASGYHRLLQACVGGDDARIVAGVDEIASQWAERSTRRDFQVDNLAHEGPGEWNAHVVDFRCAAILKAFDRTAFVITARPDFPHVWRGGFQRDGRTS